jgi:prefoldin subunit 5
MEKLEVEVKTLTEAMEMLQSELEAIEAENAELKKKIRKLETDGTGLSRRSQPESNELLGVSGHVRDERY